MTNLRSWKIESRFFSAMPSDRFKYEVDNDYERHVVDLTKKECTCRIWDLIDIPCKHGVSAIYKNREQPEDYLHNGYLKETYLEVYNDLRPLGRRKKLRRDPDKPRNPHKVSRLNRDIKCGKCKKVGHNSRSCNIGITSETSWQRRQRLKQQNTVSEMLHALSVIYLGKLHWHPRCLVKLDSLYPIFNK